MDVIQKKNFKPSDDKKKNKFNNLKSNGNKDVGPKQQKFPNAKNNPKGKAPVTEVKKNVPPQQSSPKFNKNEKKNKNKNNNKVINENAVKKSAPIVKPKAKAIVEELIKKVKSIESSNDLKTQVKTKVKDDDNQTEQVTTKKFVTELIPKAKVAGFVKNFLKLVKHEDEETKKKNKQLLDDKSTNLYRIEVTSMKIPNCSRGISKIKLPNPIHTKEQDICFIAADLKRGRKFDEDPQIEEIEKTLAEQGIDYINKVMTISHLIKEYSSFEQKRKLAHSYDVFITDSRIAHRANIHFGKCFIQARKNPIQVRKLTKDDFDTALTHVCFTRTSTGHLTSIHFGSVTLSDKKLTENLYSLFNSLNTSYPGGWANIKSISLRYGPDITIPIYHNFSSPNFLPVPEFTTQIENHIKKQRESLNDVFDNIKISKDGTLKAIKRKEMIQEILNDNPIKKEETKIEPSITEKKSEKKAKKRAASAPTIDTVKVIEEAEEAPKPVVETKKIKKSKEASNVPVKQMEPPMTTNKKNKNKNKNLKN